MTKKLIALDMDGTFLNSDHETISEANLKAVNDVLKAGHKVMICTGRPHETLHDVLKPFGLEHLPVSGSNGAATMIDGEVVDYVGVPHADAKEIFEFLAANEFPFQIYTDTGPYGPSNLFELADAEIKLAKKFIEADYFLSLEGYSEYMKKRGIKLVESFDDIGSERHVLKFFIIVHDPQKREMLLNLGEKFDSLIFTSSGKNNIEINAKGADKGHGVAVVAKHYGIDMKDTVAMGDNYNDLGMIKAAGLSVAMENAEDTVKEMADVITKHHNEDGVAHAIYKWVLV